MAGRIIRRGAKSVTSEAIENIAGKQAGSVARGIRGGRKAISEAGESVARGIRGRGASRGAGAYQSARSATRNIVDPSDVSRSIRGDVANIIERPIEGRRTLRGAKREVTEEMRNKRRIRGGSGSIPKPGDANFIGPMPDTFIGPKPDSFIGPPPPPPGPSGGGGSSWGEFGKKAWNGFVENTFSKEGMDRFVGNAIAGAGWGAAIGGTTEALQGGSFVEGAKRGAYQGVVYGGAVGTALGSVARGFNPNASGPRGTYNEISKQLSAVMKNRGAAGAAKGVTGYSATKK